jgi:Putative lumazine-binding
MEQALHPELVKRCRGIEDEDPDAPETLSARQMIEATADGEERREDAADRRIEIRIDYLSGGIASVQCFCHRYVDLLHLIDMPDGWKIVNAAWRLLNLLAEEGTTMTDTKPLAVLRQLFIHDGCLVLDGSETAEELQEALGHLMPFGGDDDG